MQPAVAPGKGSPRTPCAARGEDRGQVAVTLALRRLRVRVSELRRLPSTPAAIAAKSFSYAHLLLRSLVDAAQGTTTLPPSVKHAGQYPPFGGDATIRSCSPSEWAAPAACEPTRTDPRNMRAPRRRRTAHLATMGNRRAPVHLARPRDRTRPPNPHRRPRRAAERTHTDRRPLRRPGNTRPHPRHGAPELERATQAANAYVRRALEQAATQPQAQRRTSPPAPRPVASEVHLRIKADARRRALRVAPNDQ